MTAIFPVTMSSSIISKAYVPINAVFDVSTVSVISAYVLSNLKNSSSLLEQLNFEVEHCGFFEAIFIFC